MNTGSVQDQLLAEQRAYYSSLAPDYLDQGLDLPAVDNEAEGSRGLWLVEALAARWGYKRGGGQAKTWFEIQALLQPMQHSA
jgi:hypothetical protein